MAKKVNKQSMQELRGKIEPLSASMMSLPQAPLRKAEEYLDAYSGYPYTAISAIAQEVASIDLHLFRVKYVKGQPQTEEIFEHAILSFLQYVNPTMTLYDTIEATQTYEDLQGEAYWAVLREGPQGKGEPKEIWLLRPDWIKIVPDAQRVVGKYIYMPGGNQTNKIEIDPDNIVPFKYFNPKNPYRGKGSVQAAAISIDIHDFAQKWNRNFFFNSATPGLVFTTDKQISATAIQRFMAQWKSEHAGMENSQKVAFIGGGFTVNKTSLNPKDMDFSEQQRVTRDDILAVFKVPKTVLGLTDDVNKANAEATTRAFMERVITPRMKKFVGTLNEFLIPMFGEEDLFLDFTDPAPEDVEQKLKTYENGRKYGWLTANEIRVQENLEPIEGGDSIAPVSGGTKPQQPDTQEPDDKQNESLMTFFRKLFRKEEKKVNVIQVKAKPFKHMMPLPAKKPSRLKRETLVKNLTSELTELIGEMIKEKDYEAKVKKQEEKKKIKEEKALKQVPNKFKMDKEARDEHWRKFVRKTDNWELAMKRITIKLFDQQEATVLAKLETLKHWKRDVRKSAANSLLQSLKDMVRPWMATLLPFIRDIVSDAGRDALDFLGSDQGDLDLTTTNAVRFLKVYGAELVTGINETTRNSLKDTLAEGLKKGESIPQLRERVKDVFAIAKTSRTEKIARSEVLRASNFATNEAYLQSGVVTGKEWLTALDSNVCPFCQSLDGKIVEINKVFFKEGDTYKVGNEVMKVDYTDIGYPPLHTNCRCTLIPVVLD